MPNITADKAVNHDLYAKLSVTGYSLNDVNSHVLYNWNNGERIGNIFSYVQDQNGQVWWMIYVNDNDYNSFTPTYIKHDSNKLSLPDLPGILEQIAQEQEKQLIEQKGLLVYYLDKYLPYIAIGIVAAIVVPVILKNRKNG